MTELLDGKKLAEKIKGNISREIENSDIDPTLAAVLIGDNPSSKKYLELKDKDCSEVGINFKNFKLPSDASISEVKDLLEDLNQDSEINGIIVQLPAPDHINQKEIIKTISPNKDVDGLNPYNVGELWTGNYQLNEDLIPCTPKGIMKFFDEYDIDLNGKETVIINRTNLVGNPLAKLMLDKNSTVTVCHSKTKNIANKAKNAEILITAVGNRPEFVVTEDMIQKGAIVVDVGMNYSNGNLKGDVNFEEVKQKCSYITPVPGGVGPMTRVILLENVLIASK